MTDPEPASAAHPYLDKRRTKIRSMFDGVAPTYDRLNHLLSFQIDRFWRSRAVAEMPVVDHGLYLDACSGTGDLAFAWTKVLDKAKDARVISADFSVAMLERGVAKRNPKRSIPHDFIAGDTTRFPFADETFDAVSVGFGIRNVENLDGGLREILRVLKPGGVLVILEFTPARGPVGMFFGFYNGWVMPTVGRMLSTSRDDAYRYLHESIDEWPNRAALASKMEDAGFTTVTHRSLAPGIVALHRGVRP